MPQIETGSVTKGASGLTRIWRAFFYSLDGFGNALRSESAFRQECVLALILIPLSCFLPVGWAFHSLLVASVLLVLTVELLNSSIEAVVDYISLEKHPLAKKAKDMGSAAVFVSLVSCGVVWGCALWAWFSRSQADKLLDGLR